MLEGLYFQAGLIVLYQKQQVIDHLKNSVRELGAALFYLRDLIGSENPTKLAR